MDVMEHRRVARCSLRLPVRFSWRGTGPCRWHGLGFTVNISSEGLYVVAQGRPRAGSKVRFEVLLPSFDGEPPSIRMQGGGRVVRIERIPSTLSEWGFAVESQCFSLWEYDTDAKPAGSDRLAG